jgi:hypothetical protein
MRPKRFEFPPQFVIHPGAYRRVDARRQILLEFYLSRAVAFPQEDAAFRPAQLSAFPQL